MAILFTLKGSVADTAAFYLIWKLMENLSKFSSQVESFKDFFFLIRVTCKNTYKIDAVYITQFFTYLGIYYYLVDFTAYFS